MLTRWGVTTWVNYAICDVVNRPTAAVEDPLLVVGSRVVDTGGDGIYPAKARDVPSWLMPGSFSLSSFPIASAVDATGPSES